MKLFSTIKPTVKLFAFLLLVACQDNSTQSAANQDLEKEPQETALERLEGGKQAKKVEAMTHPHWRSAAGMPEEWGGLYEKDCVLAGPEQSKGFSYNQPANNTSYLFSHIVFPSETALKPESSVVPIKIDQVWENDKWPGHFLFYALESYSQILVEDGRSYGQHQKLDGQSWDMFEHLQTKYRSADHVRWSADMDDKTPYGDGPPCSPALAGPWQGIMFREKSGAAYTLSSIMEK